MTNHYFSIICPVFNGEKYILRAVNSILKQTYECWELIIVDDGSTDSTLSLLNKNYANCNKIFVYSQKNSGVFNARELGLSKSRGGGSIILFLDADDTYKPDALQLLNNLFNQYNVDLIKYGFTAIRSDGTFDREIDFESYCLNGKESVFKNCISGGLWNKAVKRECIKDCFFDEPVRHLKIAEDMALSCSYLINCNSCYMLNKSLYNYYVIPDQQKVRKTYTLIENRIDYTFVYLPFVYDTLIKEHYNCADDYGIEIILSLFSLLKVIFSTKLFNDKKMHLDTILNHPNFDVVSSLYKKMNLKQRLIFKLFTKRKYRVLNSIYRIIYQ